LADRKKRLLTLVIAKLDRLARNVHFISGLIESGADAVIGLDKDLGVFVTIHPIRNPRSPRWTSERTLLSHHLSQIIPREEQCPSPSQSSEKHKIDIAQREAKERTVAPVKEERARSADSPRELERDEEGNAKSASSNARNSV